MAPLPPRWCMVLIFSGNYWVGIYCCLPFFLMVPSYSVLDSDWAGDASLIPIGSFLDSARFWLSWYRWFLEFHLLPSSWCPILIGLVTLPWFPLDLPYIVPDSDWAGIAAYLNSYWLPPRLCLILIGLVTLPWFPLAVPYMQFLILIEIALLLTLIPIGSLLDAA